MQGRISAEDFCWAANGGDLSTVQQYLKENEGNLAAINVRAGYNGNTALCLAAMHNHIDIFNLLLATNGIDINVANQHRCTPLAWATHGGHIDLVRRLLKSGAKTDVIATDNTSALSWAIHGHNCKTEIIALLLSEDDI